MLPIASKGCRLTWPSGAATTILPPLRGERKPPVDSGFVPCSGLTKRPSLVMSHRGALPPAVGFHGGDIYGFGGPLNIHAYSYATVDVQQVVANISMHGTELLYDQVMLVWTDGLDGGEEGFLMADVSINYWEEVDFGGGVGAIANVSYVFDLSTITADIREIGVLFQTAGAHSSLDAMALDLQTVPAPGALVMLALAGLCSRRRR